MSTQGSAAGITSNVRGRTRLAARLAALIMLLWASVAAAQETRSGRAPELLYWLDVGAGGGEYFGMMADVAVKANSSDLFLIRGSYMEELQICIFGPCESAANYQGDVAGMYGRIYKGRWGSIAGAAGAAVTFIRTDRTGGGEQTASTTIGLPLQVQAVFTPFSFIGLGVSGTANINPVETFAGAFITLQIGRLY
jgi:hypothetical protein